MLVVAGTYALFTLGIQLNVGFTGILNFGQAGFMAIGAYVMGLLVVRADWPLYAAMPAATLAAIATGLIVGIPSLRLRADYFAIATIAFGEIVVYTFENSDFAGGSSASSVTTTSGSASQYGRADSSARSDSAKTSCLC